MAIAGRDTLVLMPTGGGKSLCYQLPALMMQGLTVVISPLISLMNDQVSALRANGIPAAALHSALDANENLRLRMSCRRGALKLLYMSPETAMLERVGLLNDVDVSLIAVDEAHCVSQWGHDFRPEYTQLKLLHEQFACVPMMALTATADKLTRSDIISQLGLREPKIFESSFDRPNLHLQVVRGMQKAEKNKTLYEFVLQHKGMSGIVYCLSRKTAEDVAAFLLSKRMSAAVYHAGLSAEQRAKAQNDFIFDRVQIVCATIAFGMGIDKSNVRWVVHYNMPRSIESFYQEIGRVGRDGLPADTLMFYSLSDYIQQEKFVQQSGQREINHERLRRMQEYAEAVVCRRRILLNYFGETTDHDCNNCDVCENPPRRFNGTVLAQKALSAIVRTEQQADVAAVADIVAGRFSEQVKQHSWFQLKTFGVGADIARREWLDFILQFLQIGLIEIAYDKHNSLHITPLGVEVLRGRKEIELSVVQRKADRRRGHPSRNSLGDAKPMPHSQGKDEPMANADDEELFQLLRALRRQISDERGWPPYVVMNDSVLRNIVRARPLTVEAFRQISGIGKQKCVAYGQQFVSAVRSFMKK